MLLQQFWSEESYGVKTTSMFPRPILISDRQPFILHDFLGLISSWVPARRSLAHKSGRTYQFGPELDLN